MHDDGSVFFNAKDMKIDCRKYLWQKVKAIVILPVFVPKCGILLFAISSWWITQESPQLQQ